MRDPATVAGMLCPHCRVGLVMSERQGVEIDYCPQCRGVWLDRGELDKIIGRAAAEEARSAPPPQAQTQPQHQPQPQWSAPQPHYGQPQHGHYDDRHGHHYKKRRKSFLEELFD